MVETKRRLGILRLASRVCGLSYRSAHNRGIHTANDLKKEGYLYIHDTGRNKGRFVFRLTDVGKDYLERCNNEQSEI